MNGKRLIWFVLAVLTLPGICAAAMQTATYTAVLNASSLQVGQTAVAAVVVDIKPGLHAQSHTPLTGTGVNYIKFEVTPDANPDVDFLDPIYPDGKIETFVALGPQSVYTGEVIVYLPMRVKTTAAVGPATISGKLTWQACNDHVCFAPARNQVFTIDTSIVPASATVTPVNQSKFSGFDPRVFAAAAPEVGQVAPTEASTPSGTTIDFFGRTFVLGASSHGLALLIALAVGVLFNLMPCVLPVLPLKVIGFVQASQKSRARCFLLGCVFSLGVICFFGILAQLVVVSRFLQWGQLFSYGWFIWGVVVVLLAMAAGMFGLFEFILPAGVYNVALTHETILGNFVFGIFTAVLSSPCVAPMFAGILAWALAQPTAVGVSAFLMVGVGMALPYLILSAFPNLVKWIPRSGPWSGVLKQTMAFFVLAVAVYFAGGRFLGRDQIFFAIFVVIAIGMVFMVGRIALLTKRVRPIAISLVAAAAVVLVSYDITMRFVGGLLWQPYTDQAFAAARASGRPVLVEFTANWCPNCLSIEASVFRDPRTAAALKHYDVVLIRADLTSEDAPGWPKVNELNPGGGIPLTAIYAPHGDEPDKLTSLYTTQNLLDALKGAAGA
jgi:thiol:disulfide interchange protein